ncbi:MAG TPA: hypothetical protein VNN80_35735, partial [Polyangiaceae bacterium]|nr:hypothetical protein [Polyangiaceae bacterium]
MPGWLRSALRWTLRGTLALLLVAASAVAAASLYLSTAQGKARLLRTVVAAVNQLLPGTVSARELTQLSPTQVVLHDLSL